MGAVECFLISDPWCQDHNSAHFPPPRRGARNGEAGGGGGEGWGRGTLNTLPSNHFIRQYLPRGQTHVQSKGHGPALDHLLKILPWLGHAPSPLST